MKKRLTIQDLANLAGVSKATVSRVLNQKPTVDPEIREHVLKIIEEHGFVPDATAAALRGGRTQLIGVLSPQGFVPDILLGVTEAVQRHRYQVILYTVSPESNQRDLLDYILGMKLTAGLVVVQPRETHMMDLLSQIQANGVPIVTIEDQVWPINAPWIGIDNIRGGYEATRYLLSLGHRRIGHLTGPTHILCTSERYEGYCRALREAGIEPDPALLWHGNFNPVSGRDCAQTLFALPVEQRPSAIFVANDWMAIGLLDVAERYGISIPDDLSIISFDDTPTAAFTKPGLTTIKQPHYSMGTLACELLLSLIDPENHAFRSPPHALLEREEDTGKPTRIVLPTELIVRESCSRAP